MQAIYNVLMSLYRITGLGLFRNLASSINSAQRTGREVDYLKRNVKRSSDSKSKD